MKNIFSIKDIKKIENAEFKRRGNSFSLMKSAGFQCSRKIIKLIRRQPVVVVCGPGNNGGDGFILAECLRKKNFLVNVFCLKKKIYKGDALKALKKLRLKTKNFSEFKIEKKSVIIDCLFGTGLSRKILGNLFEETFFINLINLNNQISDYK